ncbi:hypothetical protein D3C72_502720 [compost metagenome]
MTRPDLRTAGWLFLAFLCLYLLTSGGHFYASDDQQKLAVLESLFKHGTVAIEGGWVPGVAEQRFSWFPLGASALMLPGYLLGQIAVQVFPMLPETYVVRFCVAMQNAAISAGLVALSFTYLRWLGRSVGASLLTAIALGAGTMVWPYAKTAWSEPGATLFILAGLFAMQIAEKRGLATGWLLGAGAAMAAAAAIRQELGLIAIGAMGYLAWAHRAEGFKLVPKLVCLAAPLVPVALGAVLYDGLRYGALFTFPNYRLPQSHLVMEEGRFGWSLKNVFQYTLSPNQGLLWFSPPVILGLLGLPRVWREHRAVGALFLAALAPLAVFYVYGWGLSSWAWGLRYSYVFLPFLIFPMAWVLDAGRRKAFVGLLAVGVAVQALGVLHDFNRLYEDELAAHQAEQLTIQQLMTTPSHSPLWLAVRATPGTLANGWAIVTAPADPAESVTELRQRRRNLPDQWFVLQLLSPIPRFLTALAALALALALAVATWRLAFWARVPRVADTPETPEPPVAMTLTQGGT